MTNSQPQSTIEIEGRTITVTATEISIKSPNGVKTLRRFPKLQSCPIPSTPRYAQARAAAPAGFIAVHQGNPESPLCFCSSAVAEYVISMSLEKALRLPGVYPSRAATEAYQAVNSAFRSASNLQDYPGRYFPALNKAKALREAWRSQFPGSALLSQADSLKADAAEIEDNYSDLDGSLSPEDINQLNADREQKRQELWAEARRLEAEARGYGDVEIQI